MSDDNSKKSYVKTIMIILCVIGVLALGFAAYSYFYEYEKIDKTNPENDAEANKWKNYAMAAGAVGLLSCIGAFVLYRKQNNGESSEGSVSSESALAPEDSNDDDLTLEAEEEQLFQSV